MRGWERWNTGSRIDAVIDRFSKVKTAKMKPVIREILRMSVYQILYMERVPDSAVCNEAVKLAKKRKFQGLSGFVNGVLRTVSREKENLSWKDASIRYSIPQWMLSMWEEMFGKETAGDDRGIVPGGTSAHGAV